MLLFELLGDESELIQESAMEALARMPAERVRPLLVQALAGDDPEAQVRAAQTLGLMRDAGRLGRARRSPRARGARRCAPRRCRRSGSCRARS